MTLEQLIVRLEQQRAQYASEVAELKEAGEPVAVDGEQLLLAELCGFVVNLQTGKLCQVGLQPFWLGNILAEAAEPERAVQERVQVLG